MIISNFSRIFGYFVDTSSAGLLKQAVLPVVNLDKCNSTDYLDGEATDNMICAGYDKGGIDSCQVITAVILATVTLFASRDHGVFRDV